MSSITKIETQAKNKNRVNIFIDDEFALGTTLEIAMKNRLKKGMEITTEELEKLAIESEYSDCFSKALNYVSKTLKTKKQVRTYLLGKGFSEGAIMQAIDRLLEYKYIDDEEYVKKYIEGNSLTEGKNLLSYKLMNKGISKTHIDRVYALNEGNGRQGAVYTLKKYMRNKEITKETLAKAYRYLVGRGFGYEDVGYAMDELKQELKEDE